MRVLVVEDSEKLRRSLAAGLSRSGFRVDLAAHGEEGLQFCESYPYEVVILDLMMPGLSGFEVLSRLRGQGNDVHVLILSAKDQVEDRILGLSMGADDYLVKPFELGELCARLQALVRRKYQQKNPRLQLGPIEIDLAQRRVLRSGKPVHLTPGEYGILELLALRRGQVLSKARLADHLHRGDSEITSNVIEVMVSRLRIKIQSPGGVSLIETRRGYGYVMETPRND